MLFVSDSERYIFIVLRYYLLDIYIVWHADRSTYRLSMETNLHQPVKWSFVLQFITRAQIEPFSLDGESCRLNSSAIQDCESTNEWMNLQIPGWEVKNCGPTWAILFWRPAQFQLKVINGGIEPCTKILSIVKFTDILNILSCLVLSLGVKFGYHVQS